MNLYGYEFERESDLTHHGIKGQKWGIRRFQNEDMTWTAAGKERYGDNGSTGSSEGSVRSVKGNLHRALAANYGLNAKFYAKRNHALSSMNKAAQTDQLKKAAKADAAKAAKKNAAQNKKADRKAIKAEKKATRLARIYELNEHTYTRLGNKTMASMNRAAKNEQLKKAAQSRQARLGRSAVSRSR